MRLAILLCLLLGACNTASPPFRGLPATRVVVDGSTFDVRVRDTQAEAIRLNMEYAPRFGPIRERAGKAMAQVSGCEVKKVLGDQALATGILDCGKGTPKPRYAPHPGQGVIPADCVPVRGTKVQGVGTVTVDLDCY